jgi:hypothetical protein
MTKIKIVHLQKSYHYGLWTIWFPLLSTPLCTIYMLRCTICFMHNMVSTTFHSIMLCAQSGCSSKNRYIHTLGHSLSESGANLQPNPVIPNCICMCIANCISRSNNHYQHIYYILNELKLYISFHKEWRTRVMDDIRVGVCLLNMMGSINHFQHIHVGFYLIS